MRDARRCEREPSDTAPGADARRRRLLLAIAGLPFAASSAWTLVGCSDGEPARRPEPERGDAAPARPDAAPPAPAEPPAAAPAEPSAGDAPPAHDALVTEVASMRPTVTALQYVNESTRPDQHCSDCQFFTEKKPERGSCQLFTEGLVATRGWCTSWTKRATAA